MEGDTNPNIGRIGGAIQIGIYEDDSIQKTWSEPLHRKQGIKHLLNNHAEPQQMLLPPKNKLAIEKYETDETRSLNTK